MTHTRMVALAAILTTLVGCTRVAAPVASAASPIGAAAAKDAPGAYTPDQVLKVIEAELNTRVFCGSTSIDEVEITPSKTNPAHFTFKGRYYELTGDSNMPDAYTAKGSVDMTTRKLKLTSLDPDPYVGHQGTSASTPTFIERTNPSDPGTGG